MFDLTLGYSFPRGIPALDKSLREHGCLQPLLVAKLNDKRVLVSGHRRYAVLRETTADIPIRELNISDPRQALKISLSENLSHRTFNLIEQARVIYILKSVIDCSDEEILQDWLPLLGLHANLSVLQGLLSISGLQEADWKFICEQRLPLKTARRIAQFEQAAPGIWPELFSKLTPGVNRIEEMLENLDLIAKREQLDLKELSLTVLNDSVIAGLLDSPQIDSVRKTEGLREFIHARAYPQYSRLRSRYEQILRNLKLSSQLALRPPPWFEGDRYELSMKVQSPEEFKKMLGKLEDLSNDERFRELFDLL